MRRNFMKSKLVLFLICGVVLSLLPLQSQAQKVAVFNQFGQPSSFAIGNDSIYIHEKTTIFIFDLKDYKFISKFGKEGEGPGELMINPFGPPMGIVPYKDKVYVSSLAKLIIFSKTGEYIKEYKVNSSDFFYPFGEKYVCLSTAPKEENSQEIVLALFIADENLNKKKIIYKSDFEVGPNFKFDFPLTPFYPFPEEDKLFVIAGIHGFAIDVFNRDGEKLYCIKRDHPKLKIPSSYKDKTMQWFKTAPNFKELYEFFKTRISIKEYYPPIYTIEIDNGKIYVFTNRFKKDQRECIVTDLKGNEKKIIYLPMPEQYGLDYNFHFTIHNDYFYKLEENIDEETWELFKIKL
jgi:hypothetical protein